MLKRIALTVALVVVSLTTWTAVYAQGGPKKASLDIDSMKCELVYDLYNVPRAFRVTTTVVDEDGINPDDPAAHVSQIVFGCEEKSGKKNKKIKSCGMMTQTSNPPVDLSLGPYVAVQEFPVVPLPSGQPEDRELRATVTVICAQGDNCKRNAMDTCECSLETGACDTDSLLESAESTFESTSELSATEVVVTEDPLASQ